MAASAVGVIFSNLHEENVPELVRRRTIASVPFGGRYRLIDFPLSNMVNAGITTVGIMTNNNYRSLIDHLGSGKDWDLARKDGGIILLPPFSDESENLYVRLRKRIASQLQIIGQQHAQPLFPARQVARHRRLADAQPVGDLLAGKSLYLAHPQHFILPRGQLLLQGMKECLAEFGAKRTVIRAQFRNILFVCRAICRLLRQPFRFHVHLLLCHNNAPVQKPFCGFR